MGWKLIWKAKVHQRVKTFCWVLVHERILTNHERWRRKIGANPGCARYDGREKDALHAIRCCKYAREVWDLLVPPGFASWFFSLDLKDWLGKILKLNMGPGDELWWSDKVLIVCWW